MCSSHIGRTNNHMHFCCVAIFELLISKPNLREYFMIIKLSFHHPEFVPTSKDATEYIFPYNFVNKKLLGMPEEVSETKYYKIKVSITRTLQSMWQLSEDDLLKVLYEYIKRYLSEKIKLDSIRNNEEYSLSTDSHPKKSPYDPTRIQYLDSVEFEFIKSNIVTKAPMRGKARILQPQKAKIKTRATIKQKTPTIEYTESTVVPKASMKKRARVIKNNKSKKKTSASKKKKTSMDPQGGKGSGIDPNIKLAYDSDILNDTPVTGDLDLGYEIYVNAFVALIDKYGKDIAPLTIGINGEWGSGKTSLMDSIRKRLNKNKYICIWFNAWKYKEEESIWRAFLRHSLRQVGDSLVWWKRLWYKLKILRLNYFVGSILVAAIFFPIIYGMSQVLKIDYPVWLLMIGIVILLFLEIKSKLHSAGFDLGERLTKKIGKKTSTDFMGDIETDMSDFIEIYSKINRDDKPLIVFIDDLDRCPPERIVSVMNAINTITYLENTIFFLGYDTKFVGMAIGKHYSNVLGQGDAIKSDQSDEDKIKVNPQLDFGLNFLDKIVQIPFRLPRPGVTDLNKFIKKVLKVESASISSEDGIIEDENKDSPNKVIRPVDGLKISDDIAITIEGPDRENLAAVTAEILESGVKEYGLSNIRKIKRFISTFRLLYEIGTESNLLTEYRISPQQLGYFLYFHLFNKRELEMQVSYMKGLSPLQLEIDDMTEVKDKPKNKIIDKLDIVFTDKDNSEIEKYRILDEFVRGSVS